MTARARSDPAPDCALTLYVSGASDLSARAVADASQLCDQRLHGRCVLSVVDVHDEPAGAIDSLVLTTPTLVRTRPLPVRRVVGDLSQVERVLTALDLER